MSITEVVLVDLVESSPEALIGKLRFVSEQLLLPDNPSQADIQNLLDGQQIPQLLCTAVENYGIVDPQYISLKTIFGCNEAGQRDFFATVYPGRPGLSGFHAYCSDPVAGQVAIGWGVPISMRYSLDRSRPLWEVPNRTPESYLADMQLVAGKIADALAEVIE